MKLTNKLVQQVQVGLSLYQVHLLAVLHLLPHNIMIVVFLTKSMLIKTLYLQELPIGFLGSALSSLVVILQ